MDVSGFIKRIVKNRFVFVTSAESLLIAILYIIKGFSEQFFLSTYFLIFANFLYPVLALIYKEKIFPFFYTIYGFILIFTIATTPTMMCNNHSVVLVLFTVLLIKNEWRFFIVGGYILLSFIAFSLNSEPLSHFLIHLIRALKDFYILDYFVSLHYEKKILDLTKDDIFILEHLASGKQQKEIRCMNKNTVTEKLKKCRLRNNVSTTGELLSIYNSSKRKGIVPTAK